MEYNLFLMYVSSWIFIGAVIVLICFFATRFHKARNEKKIKESDDWRENMLDHAMKWKEATGRDYPSYEEMLGLSEEYFQTFLFVRAGIPEEREILLEEMRTHEMKTYSFSADRDEVDLGTKAVIDIFSQSKGEAVTKAVSNLHKTAMKYGSAADGDPMKSTDPVILAIYAKALQDYFEKKKKSEDETTAGRQK